MSNAAVIRNPCPVCAGAVEQYSSTVWRCASCGLSQPYAYDFWPHGIDWSGAYTHCAMGCSYRDLGVEQSGPGQRRTFGGGRKARGYASGTDGRPMP
jgi:hypothetical protein